MRADGDTQTKEKWTTERMIEGDKINSSGICFDGHEVFDKTKEELFDMVIDLNSNYNVPHSMKRKHLLLSQRLSSQIQPRPYDPAW